MYLFFVTKVLEIDKVDVKVEVEVFRLYKLPALHFRRRSLLIPHVKFAEFMNTVRVRYTRPLSKYTFGC